ncbi:MAG: DUF1667 domain-containing protein [Desulfurococcaceae archaeon]|jgi:CxxC motif-containing protein|nr:DUF1667 domain-containing protein [Desulfurococcaceae archaeon]
MSCTLKVHISDTNIEVTGNQCIKGVEYAKQEALNPVRHVMTVVKVRGGDLPTVSLITSKPVPKNCIEKVMEATANIELEAPVELGQVVVRDVCGANLITTRKVHKALH